MGLGRYARDIYVLGAVRVLRSFTFGYIAFVLPLYLEHIGFRPEGIGLYALIATVSSAALTLASGWLGDLYSRRRTLAVVSLLPAGTYSILLATRQEPIVMASAAFGLTLSPMGGGSGGGPVAPLQTAMVASRVGAAERTRVYSMLTMASILSALAGSAFSGAVIRAYRADYYQVLLLLALVVTVSTSGLVLAISEEADRLATASSRRSVLPRRSATNIGKVSLAGMMGSLGLGLVMALIPVYFKDVGASELEVSIIYDASYAATALSMLAAPRAERLLGPVKSILVLRGLGSALLAAIPFLPLPAAAAVYVARSALYQAALPIRQNVSMELYSPDERSRGLSITGLFRRLPYGVAAAVGSILFQAGLFALLFAAAGAVSLLDPVLYYAFFRYVDRGQGWRPREAGPGNSP